MSLFTTHTPGTGRFVRSLDRLSEQFDGWRLRLLAAWARHRAERALESLPYDTLKDIGFPSANTVRGRLAE